MSSTLTWTGQSMRNAGLLYQSYANLGVVRDESGREIGTVLELVNGRYLADIGGIRADNEQDTATDAHAMVDYLHAVYRMKVTR